ncbi:hypothetical protein CYMTET_17285, partial [Cymbomonas tetramitiformis]
RSLQREQEDKQRQERDKSQLETMQARLKRLQEEEDERQRHKAEAARIEAERLSVLADEKATLKKNCQAALDQLGPTDPETSHALTVGFSLKPGETSEAVLDWLRSEVKKFQSRVRALQQDVAGLLDVVTQLWDILGIGEGVRLETLDRIRKLPLYQGKWKLQEMIPILEMEIAAAREKQYNMILRAQALWDTLETPLHVRQEFMNKHSGLTEANLAALQEGVNELEARVCAVPEEEDFFMQLKNYMAYTRIRLPDLIARTDSNADGLLQVEELEGACQRVGIPYTQRTLNHFQQRMGFVDGAVPIRQFYQAFRKHEKHLMSHGMVLERAAMITTPAGAARASLSLEPPGVVEAFPEGPAWTPPRLIVPSTLEPGSVLGSPPEVGVPAADDDFRIRARGSLNSHRSPPRR